MSAMFDIIFSMLRSIKRMRFERRESDEEPSLSVRRFFCERVCVVGMVARDGAVVVSVGTRGEAETVAETVVETVEAA